MPTLDPLSDRFASIWRALDASMFRLVWPVGLGAVVAALAMLVTRSIIAGSVIALVVIGVIGWFGKAVARRLEELDRIAD